MADLRQPRASGMLQDMPALDYTPVRARRGRLVHAALAATPRQTACGRVSDGYLVATAPADCPRCVLAVGA